MRVQHPWELDSWLDLAKLLKKPGCELTLTVSLEPFPNL